jgi:hypothetical protein
MIPTKDDELWLAGLSPEWQAYIEKDRGLRNFLGHQMIIVREGNALNADALQTMDLAPLARIAGLREFIWVAAPLESLRRLPELGIRELSVKTQSLEGIERFPRLAKLVLYTAVPLGPLARAAKLRNLWISNDAPDLTELAAASLLTELDVTPRDAAQFAQLAELPKLHTLHLDLVNIPRAIDELDWSPLKRLKSLTIRHAEPTSLDRLAPLLKLENIEFDRLGGTDIGALGALPKLRYVQIRPSAPLLGVEEMAANPALVSVASDINVLRVVHRHHPEMRMRQVMNKMTEEEDAEFDSWFS